MVLKAGEINVTTLNYFDLHPAEVNIANRVLGEGVPFPPVSFMCWTQSGTNHESSSVCKYKLLASGLETPRRRM